MAPPSWRGHSRDRGVPRYRRTPISGDPADGLPRMSDQRRSPRGRGSASGSGSRSDRSGSSRSGQSSGESRSGQSRSGQSGRSRSGQSGQSRSGPETSGQTRSGQGGRSRDDRDRDAPARDRGFGPYGAPNEEAGRRPRGKTTGKGAADRDRRAGDRRARDGGTSEERAKPRRPALRTVGERRTTSSKSMRDRRPTSPAPAPARRRRRRSGPADVDQEIRRLAGRNGDRFVRLLMEAADAFADGRERDALRLLRPLRDQIPDSQSVRELVGLCQYRIGNYAAAAKELEAYVELSGATDQNPVLMDCYRAQHRWRKVDETWQTLAEASPSAEAVAEGRIVYAGSLADRGRLPQALQVLRRRAPNVRNPKEHHLRLWYALADLEDRAGNHAVARDLFDRVRRADPGYADVAERLAALC